MNTKTSCVAIVLLGLAISGCASRASSVAAIAVPSANYKGLSCNETKVSLSQARDRKNALTNEQNNAATGDAIGVFFVLLPVGSIFGADKEGELAQAKGEVLALEGAVTINCKSQVTDMNSSGSVEESIEEKLQRIKDLQATGLISEEEADEKRKTLLDQL